MSAGEGPALLAIIAPSILACDFARLADECETLLPLNPPQSAGKEVHDGTGKEVHGDTGKEVHGDTGKEVHDDTGKEVHGDTGKEVHGDTGKEVHDDTGKEVHDGTGKEVHGDTGKEAAGGKTGPVWLHVDVMDGHFVPNLTIGPCVVRALRRRLPGVFLDVHCMVADPGRWVDELARAGASQMSFHLEATGTPREVAARIRAAGMRVGVAIRPHTTLPDARLTALLAEGLVDMVLVMTVEPGFGGQAFMPEVVPKVSALRADYPYLDIQVDGGISDKTIETVAAAGANVIVSGTYIFQEKDRRKAIEGLRKTVAKYLHS